MNAITPWHAVQLQRCDYKTRRGNVYRRRHDAVVKAARLNTGGWLQHAVKHYHCPHCGLYHIGNKRYTLTPEKVEARARFRLGSVKLRLLGAA